MVVPSSLTAENLCAREMDGTRQRAIMMAEMRWCFIIDIGFGLIDL